MGLLDKLGLQRRETTTTETTSEASDVLLRSLLTGQEITRESAMSVPAVAEAVDRIASIADAGPVT